MPLLPACVPRPRGLSPTLRRAVFTARKRNPQGRGESFPNASEIRSLLGVVQRRLELLRVEVARDVGRGIGIEVQARSGGERRWGRRAAAVRLGRDSGDLRRGREQPEEGAEADIDGERRLRLGAEFLGKAIEESARVERRRLFPFLFVFL